VVSRFTPSAVPPCSGRSGLGDKSVSNRWCQPVPACDPDIVLFLEDCLRAVRFFVIRWHCPWLIERPTADYAIVSEETKIDAGYLKSVNQVVSAACCLSDQSRRVRRVIERLRDAQALYRPVGLGIPCTEQCGKSPNFSHPRGWGCDALWIKRPNSFADRNDLPGGDQPGIAIPQVRTLFWVKY
jgi:hypothetical protein